MYNRKDRKHFLNNYLSPFYGEKGDRRVGLDDPQRSLPTPTILWFCDSVFFHKEVPKEQET